LPIPGRLKPKLLLSLQIHQSSLFILWHQQSNERTLLEGKASHWNTFEARLKNTLEVKTLTIWLGCDTSCLLWLTQICSHLCMPPGKNWQQLKTLLGASQSSKLLWWSRHNQISTNPKLMMIWSFGSILQCKKSEGAPLPMLDICPPFVYLTARHVSFFSSGWANKICIHYVGQAN
jgi:hypothetical protein